MPQLIRYRRIPLSLPETMQRNKNSYTIAKGKLVDKVERLSFEDKYRKRRTLQSAVKFRRGNGENRRQRCWRIHCGKSLPASCNRSLLQLVQNRNRMARLIVNLLVETKRPPTNYDGQVTS